MECVYFIRKGSENVFKVGKGSRGARTRLRELQVGNEARLFICALIHCPEPFEIEQYIHRSFAKHRLVGEWFSMTWEDVLSVLNYYGSIHKVEILEEEAQAALRFTNYGIMDARTHQKMLARIYELQKLEDRNRYLLQDLQVKKEAIDTLRMELAKADSKNKALKAEVDRLKTMLDRVPLNYRPPSQSATFPYRAAPVLQEIDATPQPEKKRRWFNLFG